VDEAVEQVCAYLAGCGAEHRRVAVREWGLTVEAGGWPLHVGLALGPADASPSPLLRVQAEVAAPGALDAAALLHRSRRTPLVAFTATRAGAVWVEGWLPAAAVTVAELDRLLGLLVAAAADARAAAAR
jgi:hypothetical protein